MVVKGSLAWFIPQRSAKPSSADLEERRSRLATSNEHRRMIASGPSAISSRRRSDPTHPPVTQAQRICVRAQKLLECSEL